MIDFNCLSFKTNQDNIINIYLICHIHFPLFNEFPQSIITVWTSIFLMCKSLSFCPVSPWPLPVPANKSPFARMSIVPHKWFQRWGKGLGCFEYAENRHLCEENRPERIHFNFEWNGFHPYLIQNLSCKALESIDTRVHFWNQRKSKW